MENVKVEPIAENKKTKPTTMETFPDLGCQETLVSADLVNYLGLFLDTWWKKRIKGIDGKTYVPCLGSTRFQVLVTSGFSNEIYLPGESSRG